jgi:4a-hydroxytetrahydrobiopterin dehydratase
VEEKLSAMRCEACRKGTAPIAEADRARFLEQIPGWRIVERDGIEQLERAFAFDDYARALAFTLAVGRLAEQEDHHPAILIEYGKVTIRWWTHAIGGLHRNDFIMAARVDRLTPEPPSPASDIS